MNNTEHKGNGFFNGFIFGLLIGGGLVFLFGTQKGRRVLQLLLEQVEENTQLSDLLEMPEGEEEYFDEVEEPEEVLAEDSQEKADQQDNKPHKAVAKVKRFFKGAPKKLVS